MVLGAAARPGLELVAGDGEPGLLQLAQAAREVVAPAVLVDGHPEPRDLVTGHPVVPAGHHETLGRHLHVVRAHGGPTVGLVRRLVGAEPYVAVRAEDLAL